MAKQVSSTKRGYGIHHKNLRAQWDVKVQQGGVLCARPGCGRVIEPGTPWDLGHVDGSGKQQYRGPEHRTCNRKKAPMHGVVTTKGPTTW